MNRPEWVKAKVRLHLATCWLGFDEDMPTVQGINWFNDSILLPLSVFFHNYFITPFLDAEFPIKVIEEYEDIDKYLNEYIYKA